MKNEKQDTIPRCILLSWPHHLPNCSPFNPQNQPYPFFTVSNHCEEYLQIIAVLNQYVFLPCVERTVSIKQYISQAA